MMLRPSYAGRNGVTTVCVWHLLTGCAVARAADRLVTTRMHILLLTVLSVVRHKPTFPEQSAVKESRDMVVEVPFSIVY